MVKYIWYLLIRLELILTFPSFRLYNTDVFKNEDFQYVCLNYYVVDNLVTSRQQWIKDQQIIPYCIRPLINNINFSDKIKGSGIPIKFETLRQLNVSSEKLLKWSAPIDIIEEYQLYLDDDNKTYLSGKTFFNCSYGWFGTNCEYTFFSDNSFDEIVYNVFNNKIKTIQSVLGSITNHSCYEHIKCNRGPKPICLDWREICNGHIDCLDNGIDEQNCFLLEENECLDGEYRCRNGQCIPESFLHDNERNPDCLDKSDEYYSTVYTNTCPLDPSFRCEETTCTYSFEFVCGDGECLHAVWRWPHSKQQTCNNYRKRLIDQLIFSSNENLHLSYECWSSMICTLELTIYFPNINCLLICQNSFSYCSYRIREYCPREFIFPSYPIILGHVYLAFKNNQIHRNSLETPDYLCFDKTFCPFFSSSIVIENRTCKLSEYVNIFSSCLSSLQTTNSTSCKNLNMYECAGSYKCISKHRLVDGIIDCYEKDDEYYNSSCLINQKHRFKCSSKPTKCISPINIHNKEFDCPDWEDETIIYSSLENNKVPFSMLCDGYFDLRMIKVTENEETDETHCEFWPCINQYTRCDGFWNCANGADELNCESSLCPPNEHPCISPITYNMTCLSFTRYGDGILDCLGGTDEHQYCRKERDLSRHDLFQCQNSTICLFYSALCNKQIDCPHSEDDEQFCRNSVLFPMFHMCYDILKEYRTITEEFICDKLTNASPKNYFKLENSIVNPNVKISLPSNQLSSLENNHIKKRSIDFNLQTSWLCNRGILIYRDIEKEEEICLCPPSYYGSRCEYQNERVSLTIQIRTGQTRIVYELLILLIDNIGQIHSVEQRSFLLIRDCRSKFHLNLLYKTRPKQLQ